MKMKMEMVFRKTFDVGFLSLPKYDVESTHLNNSYNMSKSG